MKNFKIIALSLLIFIALTCIVNASSNTAYVPNLGTPYTISSLNMLNNSFTTDQFLTGTQITQYITVTVDRLAITTGSGYVEIFNTTSTTRLLLDSADFTGKAPQGLAYSKDMSKLYVVNHADNSISVINTSSYAVTSFSSVASPSQIVISQDGSKMYVTSQDATPVGHVDLYYTANNTHIKQLSFPSTSWASGIVCSPDGLYVYAMDNLNGKIRIITTSTDTFTGSISITSSANVLSNTLLVTPDSSKIYLFRKDMSNLLAYTAPAGALSANVTFSNSISNIGITGDGTKLCVANSTHLCTVDTATNTITAVSSAFSVLGSFIGKFIGTDSLPVSAFSATPLSGMPPLSVSFSDASTGSPTAWSWNFGDGSTSTSQNPSHTYNANGSYTVNLTATNSAGSNTLSKVNYINVGGGSGSGGYGNGSIPFEAHFLDTSSGNPDAFYWDFGDGNTSTLQNPVHTYYTAGDYDIYHTSGKSGEWLGSQYKLDWVHVAVGGSYFAIKNYPVGDMSLSATSGTLPLTINFTSGTVGTPTSWQWIFGDSSVNSTSQNPSHIYSGAGPFSPYIKSTNANGYGELIKYNFISATLPGITTGFTANRTTVAPGQAVSFIDSSTGSLIDSWSWNFGDDTTSTATNAIKSYSTPGTYTVSHTASSSSTGLSDTETKTNYITVSGSTGYVNVSFSANVTYGNVPLTVAFTDESVNSPTSFTWDFGDGGSSTEEKPIHQYTSTGIYTVIHTATNEYGTGSLTKVSYIQVYAAGYGGIDGYVYDSSTSAVISGATLTLQNDSASAQYVTSTDGVYFFWPVYNGVYNLTAAKTGYVTQSFPNTIINGTTGLFNIYLSPNANTVSGITITNYSTNWISYAYSANPNTNVISLNYSTTTTTQLANFTVWNGGTIVYTTTSTNNATTFTYTGNSSKNYAVTFQITDTSGNRYNGVFSAIFYRGLPTGYRPFPSDFPPWLANCLVIGVCILCLILVGPYNAYVGTLLCGAVFAAGYYWGILQLGSSVSFYTILTVIVLVAIFQYRQAQRTRGI